MDGKQERNSLSKYILRQLQLTAAALLRCASRETLSSFVCSLILAALLAFLTIEWANWRAGAGLSLTAAAAVQAEHSNVLWGGPANQYADFKLHRLAEVKPEVVVIGDSPCSQIRSAMFKPYRIYNFCTTAWTFDQIQQILLRVDQVWHPKVLIFSLNYYFFLDDWVVGWTNKIPMEYDARSISAHVSHLQHLVELFQEHPKQFVQYLSGSTLERVDGMELIGADAVVLRYGIRYDGSILYPLLMRLAAPERSADPSFGLLRSVHGAAEMSATQVSSLATLAKTGNQRGIKLVGVQFPLLKATVDFLDGDTAYRPYAGAWREFTSKETQRRFKEMGIVFCDLSHDPVTADRSNFYDPMHPTERAILGALAHLMLNRSSFSAVFPELDGTSLQRKYDEAYSKGESFDVFHSDF
jgi:hypothetical protein